MYVTPIEQHKKDLLNRLFFISIVLMVLLSIGTLVYHFSEGWGYMDALYFSTISLTTRGFSELHPTTCFSVLFTIFYLFIGVGMILYLLSSLIGFYTAFYEKSLEKKFAMLMDKVKAKKQDEKWVIMKPVVGNNRKIFK